MYIISTNIVHTQKEIQRRKGTIFFRGLLFDRVCSHCFLSASKHCIEWIGISIFYMAWTMFHRFNIHREYCRLQWVILTAAFLGTKLQLYCKNVFLEYYHCAIEVQSYLVSKKMPCYLFKGLVSAEEAKILMYYVDHIYIIQKFCNLLHWALFQLVSMVQACQLSMVFLPALSKLFTFTFLAFNFSLSLF